jgi:hypothetical protein
MVAQVPVEATDTRQAQPAGLTRSRIVVVVLPVALVLAMWMYLFIRGGALSRPPSGKGLGADFATFVAAGQVMKNGGDPYAPSQLYRKRLSSWRLCALPAC